MALEIARLNENTQRELVKEDRWWMIQSLAQLRENIRRHYFMNLNDAPFGLDDDVLIPKAGACTVCPKRVGNSPDLFNDVKKGNNLCTDRGCLSAKFEAFIKETIEAKAAEDIKVQRISNQYYFGGDSKVLGSEKYSIVPEKESTSHGIFIDGGKVGKVVPIIANLERGETMKPSDGTPRAPASMARRRELYKRRLEIYENKIEQEARLRQYKSAVRRLKWPLSRKDFELIVLELGHKSHFDIDRAYELIGLKKIDHFVYEDEANMKKLGKLSDQQLVQYAFAIIADQELISDPLLNRPEDLRLSGLCSRHDIDRKKVHDEVAKEFASKKPKPPKPQEPATPKSKPATIARKPSKPKTKTRSKV